MKKINVFYHIYLCDGVDKIINEQLDKLYFLKNEIDNIDFFINMTPEYNKNFLNDLLLNRIYELTKNVTYCKENYYELPTLSLLYHHAKKTDNEFYLYFHTKGASRMHHVDSIDNFRNYSYRNVENWRKIMEHFCIDNWKICVEKLENNDLVGCNYIRQNILGVLAHYSGNFWWSKSEFIKKLSDPKNHININTDRFSAEWWIGEIPHEAICLFPVPEPIHDMHNRCFTFTNEEDYKNKIIEQKFLSI